MSVAAQTNSKECALNGSPVLKASMMSGAVYATFPGVVNWVPVSQRTVVFWRALPRSGGEGR